MRLSDKFTIERGSVYLTGIQALVRLPMDQMRRDRRAGLKTGAFISGYEGSPLGGYDLQLARSRKLLDEHNIVFRPGVNEDLAATSVMGSQIFEVAGRRESRRRGRDLVRQRPRRRPLGRHSAPRQPGGNGKKLRRAGARAATIIAARAPPFRIKAISVCTTQAIPFLYPGNTQEIIDYGLLAIALSRFSGAWVGLKLLTDICDGGGTVVVDPDQPAIRLPEGYQRNVDARLVPPVTLALEQEVNARRLQAAHRVCPAEFG